MTHKRRPARTQPNDSANQVGRCPEPGCGKPMYLTRKAAKRAAGQGRQHWGRAPEPFKCGDYWHLG